MSLTGEWVDKPWPICTAQPCSTVGMSERLHTATCAHLKGIMLIERRQTQKATYCIIPSPGHLEKAKL